MLAEPEQDVAGALEALARELGAAKAEPKVERLDAALKPLGMLDSASVGAALAAMLPASRYATAVSGGTLSITSLVGTTIDAYGSVVLDTQETQATALRRALDLATLRYRSGVSNYLEVLDAQRSLFDAQLAESQAELGELVSAVRLYKALGVPEMIADPRFRTNADRVANAAASEVPIRAFISAHTLDEGMAFFEKNEITAAPVYDIDQFMADPHVQARQIVVDLPDKDMGAIPMHAVVPRLSASPGALRRPAPDLGEHTAEVLGRVGVDAAAQQDLRRRKII